MFGTREIVIACLAAACLALGWMWRAEVVDFAKYRGEVEGKAEAAEQLLEEKRAEWAVALGDAKHEWDNELPGIREDAVKNYIRRFGVPTRLCPADGLRPQPALPAAGDGTTAPAEVHVSEVEEQLAADQAAFVRACAEDAEARNLTRETLMRMGFQPEGE